MQISSGAHLETTTVGPWTVPPAWPKPLRRGEGPVRSSTAGGKAQECYTTRRPARGRSASAAPSHGPVARNPPTNSWLCNIAAVGDRPRSVPSDVLRAGSPALRWECQEAPLLLLSRRDSVPAPIHFSTNRFSRSTHCFGVGELAGLALSCRTPSET